MGKNSINILSPNGIQIPPQFPATEYESIHKTVVSKYATHSLYEHYSGAWNAISYRYRASVDDRDFFISSIKEHGSTPPPEERYEQERMLFNFFNSAFSTFEAVFYGMYTVGAFVEPPHFPLSSEREQQKVSPSSTKRTYEEAFSGDKILIVLENLFNDAEYQKLREIRNILTHRTAPGRRMYVSIGNEDTPATEWKLNNVPVNESIASDATKELSRLLADILVGFDDFVKRHIA